MGVAKLAPRFWGVDKQTANELFGGVFFRPSEFSPYSSAIKTWRTSNQEGGVLIVPDEGRDVSGFAPTDNSRPRPV